MTHSMTPGEAPAPDLVLAEVAGALASYAAMDSNELNLTESQARSLARAAMARLCTIRDRDGRDPLPHRDVPATEPGYDPAGDLAVIALAAMRTAAPMPAPAAYGLRSLMQHLGIDGTVTLPDLVLTLRAARPRREA